MENKLSILGSGSWGTALALLAARNGCQTLLWGHNANHIESLILDRENKLILNPLVKFCLLSLISIFIK